MVKPGLTSDSMTCLVDLCTGLPMADTMLDDDLYKADAARLADRAFARETDNRRAAAQCQRCKAIDDAVPTEAQLLLLVSGDLNPEDLEFHPVAMNQSQAVAAEMLTASLSRYVKAFGVETSGARLQAALSWLRIEARIHRIQERRREARKDINARARAAWQSGGEAAARAIEAEPTPDYPGKARDDAWLAGGRYER